MLFGAHVSIAGGIDKAIARGEEIGANCIQTFASSPRTLAFSSYPDEVVNRYLTLRKNSKIQLHVFHGIYLVNLANENPDYVKLSMDSLINYQRTAARLGVLGTIFHIGSHKGVGFDTVKNQIATAIKEIINESPDNVTLMLENAAGHKGTVGQTLEELATIVELVGKDRLGLCLDTQHAFASGIDGRDKKALDDFVDRLESLMGIEMIKVIHLNDSKPEFNSHKDRHENLGLGNLGNEGLINWIHHPKLNKLPFILEVPGLDGNGPGKADINTLINLDQLCPPLNPGQQKDELQPLLF